MSEAFRLVQADSFFALLDNVVKELNTHRDDKGGYYHIAIPDDFVEKGGWDEVKTHLGDGYTDHGESVHSVKRKFQTSVKPVSHDAETVISYNVTVVTDPSVLVGHALEYFTLLGGYKEGEIPQGVTLVPPTVVAEACGEVGDRIVKIITETAPQEDVSHLRRIIQTECLSNIDNIDNIDKDLPQSQSISQAFINLCGIWCQYVYCFDQIQAEVSITMPPRYRL